MFQAKFVDKMKTHILVQPCFFRNSCRLWDKVKKYCTAGQDSLQYGVCVLLAVYLMLQTHTQNM